MQSVVPATEAPRPPSDASSLPEDARIGGDAQIMRTSRVDQAFFPQTGGDYGPATSRTIRFNVAGNDFLDLSHARFQCDFNLKCVTAADPPLKSHALLDGGIGGTIQRLRIRNMSGQELERIDDYALVQTLLNQCSDRARLDPEGLLEQEMFLTTAANISDGTKYQIDNNKSREMSHKLHGSWFQTSRKKLLPPGVAFMVEIELVSDVKDAIQAADATDVASFTLSNCSLVIPKVVIQSAAFAQRTQSLMSSGWTWSGATYKTYKTSLSSTGQSKIQVPDQSIALTGLLAVSRPVANLGHLDKLQNYTRSGDGFQNQYNVSIGGEQYPAQQIEYTPSDGTDGKSEASDASYKFAGTSRQIAAVLGRPPVNSFDSFTCTADTLGFGFLAVQCGYGQGQGVDTATSALPITFNLDSALGDAQTLSVICQSTVMYRMDAQGGGLEVTAMG